MSGKQRFHPAINVGCANLVTIFSPMVGKLGQSLGSTPSAPGKLDRSRETATHHYTLRAADCPPLGQGLRPPN
jgi:hypothetical protein